MFPQIAVGSNEKAEPGVQTSAAAQLRAKDEGALTQTLLTASFHGASMESGWSAADVAYTATEVEPRIASLAERCLSKTRRCSVDAAAAPAAPGRGAPRVLAQL